MDSMISDVEASAVRAMLGKIHPSVKVIYIGIDEGNKIYLMAIAAGSEIDMDDITNDILEASSEIVSDFPDFDICTFIERDRHKAIEKMPEQRRMIFEEYRKA